MAATATRRRRRPSAGAERLIAAVLQAQGAFFDAARRPSEEFLRAAIDLPATFDPLDAETIRAAQMEFQARFQERSAERLRLGMRKAMARPTRQGLIRDLRAAQRKATDPDVKARLEQQIEGVRIAEDPRRAAVANLLEQERRLARAHAAAMAGRARGASRSVQVRSESPTGALWMRNPLADSCDECRFLDGKLWPWEVLDQIAPPRHPNCQCVLVPVGAARARGLIGTAARVPSAKQGIQRARRVLQETIEGAILVEAERRGLLREAGVGTVLHYTPGVPGYVERQHPRGPHGRWRDRPGASVGSGAKALEDIADDAFKADPVLMDWGKFWADWERQGVTIRLTKAHGFDRLGVAGIKGEMIGPSGEKVGDFGRTFRADGRMRNVMLQTYKNAPPATGTQFVRDSLRKARGDPHIKQVSIDAGWAAGGYVWAREGAVPDQPFDEFQRYVNNERILTVKYEMEQAGVPTDAYAELRRKLEAGEFSTAAEIAAFGRDVTWTDREGRTMWPGKVAMLGTDWSATFDVGGYLSEMLRGLALWDLSERMGLLLPPDDLDHDDRTFWDAAEGMAEDLAADWREALHPRGFHGQWTDAPVSVGTRPALPEPESKIAKGYAEAAEMLAQGYREKIDRKVTEAGAGMVRAFDFLNTRATGRSGHEGSLELTDGVAIDCYGWDTGDTMFSVSAFGDTGKIRNASDPELRQNLLADLRGMAEARKAPMLEIQRKNIRGAVMSRSTEKGRNAYGELARAQEENAQEPYHALRQRFPHVPERIVVVDEKGYGRFPLGVSDVLVTAARNLDHHVTTVNGLAIHVAVDMRERTGSAASFANWQSGAGSREVQLRPGTDHITVRSTAALLRHEWGHGLYDALSDEQRQEFMALLPHSDGGIDWDAVGEGLSKYAAGDEASRADYAKRTSMVGAYGYTTETFAEALALVGGSDYEPEKWPAWVQTVGKWIERLQP